ncbi:hypothetical protein AB2N04_09995 [Nitratireductor sp. GISD-1A_MAKvit]|uniref:hypothetical protein n=1 Tax=Nitratireductor sp. GISD-1A_MAKvit TaxID=3234198 RepID=UPI00346690F7
MVVPAWLGLAMVHEMAAMRLAQCQLHAPREKVTHRAAVAPSVAVTVNAVSIEPFPLRISRHCFLRPDETEQRDKKNDCRTHNAQLLMEVARIQF